MPNAINDISLSPQYINTGLLKDFLTPGFVHRIVLLKKGRQFTRTEVQSMYASLLAEISQNIDSNRAFPIGNFTAMDDKSSDAVMTTSPIGAVTFVQDGKYHLVFEYEKGGLNFHNMLRRFHRAQDSFDLLILDKDNNAALGTQPVLNTSLYELQGYSLDLIYVEKMKFNDGSNGSKFRIGFIFSDIEEMNERLAYKVMPLTQPVLSLNGLKNLEFPYQPPYQALTAGVAKTRVTTGFGATDLYPLFAAQLVALTANWIFKDASNNTLTCTVSLEAATNTLVYTFSGAAYTALSSGSVISCYTPTISQMNATIPGFANGYFELTK